MPQREFSNQDEKQPAQSPDLDILDLRFFHSLQSRVAEIKEAGDLCAIVNAVNFALKDYDARTLDLVWQALFNVVNSILIAYGETTFSYHTKEQERRSKQGCWTGMLQ